MAQAFDTLAAANRLSEAGMDRKHAEAVAAMVRDGQGDLVTRNDLEAALAKQDRRTMLFVLAVAGALLAAIKLIP